MKRWALVPAALAPLVLAGAWWTLPDEWASPADTQTAATLPRTGTTGVDAPAGADSGALTGRTPAGAADAFLSSDLRHRLDALWLEAGDAASPIELKQRLAALVPRHFTPQDVTRALQLLDRYVDYRVALSKLKPPADLSDPRALRDALEARARVRRGHFTEDEYDTLFAQEEALDRFTIARLEILRHPELTPGQRQAALRDAEVELGEGERAARAQALLHQAVAAQTAGFEAARSGDAERFAQRRSAYGDAAAQRLAQLDAEERDWQARLSQYAVARSATAAPGQLEALKQQLFTAEEQLRVEAALALRSRAL